MDRGCHRFCVRMVSNPPGGVALGSIAPNAAQRIVRCSPEATVSDQKCGASLWPQSGHTFGQPTNRDIRAVASGRFSANNVRYFGLKTSASTPSTTEGLLATRSRISIRWRRADAARTTHQIRDVSGARDRSISDPRPKKILLSDKPETDRVRFSKPSNSLCIPGSKAGRKNGEFKTQPLRADCKRCRCSG